MKNFIQIIEDIKDILSHENRDKKIFDKDVADVLDIPQVNFATMKKRNKIPFNQLLDFCAMKSISINWLLYNQTPESLIESTNHFFTIKYFNEISASAGGGGEINDESYENILIPKILIDTLSTKSDLEAIKVTGDSMEPTFSYDDIIFIDRQKTDFRRGGVFVIRTEHGLFIKRINKRVDGKIDIISDNKEYISLTLNEQDIRLVGRVVGKLGHIS